MFRDREHIRKLRKETDAAKTASLSSISRFWKTPLFPFMAMEMPLLPPQYTGLALPGRRKPKQNNELGNQEILRNLIQHKQRDVWLIGTKCVRWLSLGKRPHLGKLHVLSTLKDHPILHKRQNNP